MVATATAGQVPRSDIQSRLLEVAERLFARHGIDAVSLNRIRTEAKSRNSSALHYHFGSKTALIEAILAHRMTAINARRHSLLAASVGGDLEQRVRSLVAALVIPFAEQMAGSAQQHGESGERNYIQFVAQVYSHPDHSIASLIHNRNASGLREATSLLSEHLSHLPGPLRDHRIRLLQSLCIHALADLERHIIADSARTQTVHQSSFVSSLIDMAVAGLLAPVNAYPMSSTVNERKRP